MQTVRWGVIGVGRFGWVHARVLSQLPGCELTALCTRNEARLAEAAEAFGARRTYTDYHALLRDEQIDAVSVTTHWRQHCEVALAGLAAGKHVLLEKPMAADSDECQRLLDAAQRARRLHGRAHLPVRRPRRLGQGSHRRRATGTHREHARQTQPGPGAGSREAR